MSKINATKRAEKGTRQVAKLRKQGLIPAILYGHGIDAVGITINEHEMELAIQHGERLLDLVIEGKPENALIKDVQWDTFGHIVLHVDFMRVNLDEEVEVTVPIHLVGTPEGAKDGGVLQQTLSEVVLTCPAGKIPEELKVIVTEMQLNDRKALSELELPEGASLVDDPHDVFCTVTIIEQDDEVQTVEDGEMPEVIGESADEGESTEE